jgi:membrane protease YdiL (CAAX protease family)
VLEEDDESEAAIHAELAMELDPSLDLRLLVAHERIEAKDRAGARSVLEQNLLSTSRVWELEQKAALLTDLEDFEAALSAFQEVERRGEESSRPFDRARALAGAGQIDAARAAYVKAAGHWASDEALRAHFEFELAHGEPESARVAYDALRARGKQLDLLLRDRFELLLAHPAAAWKQEDLVVLLVVALFVFGLALLPAFWILPVAWFGLTRSASAPPPAAGAPGFGLHQAWAVCAAVLLAQGMIGALFPGILGGGTPSGIAPPNVARLALAIFLVEAAAVLAIVRADVLVLFRKGAWSWTRTLLLALGTNVVLRAGLWLALRVFRGGTTDPLVRGLVRSVNESYGLDASLLLVAFLVPVTEEILFRGVLFSAFQRSLSPRWANFAQAALFALAHAHPISTPFSFVLGLVAGEMTRRSGTLWPAVVTHMLNNALACAVLAAYGR